MKLQLTYYNNPILRKRATEIGEITPEIEALAANMVETMQENNGVGLAAPQVGRLVRLFVVQDMVEGEDGQITSAAPEVIVNPVFSNPSREVHLMQEGCLSVPGLYLDIERPVSIHVRYQTLKGEMREEALTGFRARVFMHENDHLNGVLFMDRLPAQERKQLRAVLQEIDQKHR